MAILAEQLHLAVTLLLAVDMALVHQQMLEATGLVVEAQIAMEAVAWELKLFIGTTHQLLAQAQLVAPVWA
jgi:hypothetical protein